MNMFRSLMALSPQDVLPAVYLSSNRLASSFEVRIVACLALCVCVSRGEWIAGGQRATDTCGLTNQPPQTYNHKHTLSLRAWTSTSGRPPCRRRSCRPPPPTPRSSSSSTPSTGALGRCSTLRALFFHCDTLQNVKLCACLCMAFVDVKAQREKCVWHTLLRSSPPLHTICICAHTQTHRDLGDVAQALRVKQRLLVKPKPLAIRDVYRTIVDMSKMKGACGLSCG